VFQGHIHLPLLFPIAAAAADSLWYQTTPPFSKYCVCVSSSFFMDTWELQSVSYSVSLAYPFLVESITHMQFGV